MVSAVFVLLFWGAQAQPDYTALVNPFIGTGGHGHTYPGASRPFGMVQLSPDTRLEGWDGCSGYHYSDSIVYGFSHTHLSGTGIADYCDVLLMPAVNVSGVSGPDYRSPFSHSRELATPGYYSVFLEKENIQAELTATTRVGLHRYTYPANAAAKSVILDLEHRDQVIESYIEQVSETVVLGYRRSKSWAPDQRLYFYMEFNQPVKDVLFYEKSTPLAATGKMEGKHLKAVFKFANTGSNPLLVKVALSGVSAGGARLNMETELPGWDFDAIKRDARNAWNRELSRMAAKGGTPGQQTIFYSALYHAFLQPNTYMDVDRQYRGTDLQLHRAEDFDNYTVFSLWDTHRAEHPLLTLLDEKRTLDFIQTFLAQYREGGLLPVWELSGNETFCMIGYHSIPVITDAYAKGIRGFDAKLALEAMQHSATLKHHGLEALHKYGYIPASEEPESVSKTLEYAYDDWCISEMARMLGNEPVRKTYLQRAQGYKHLFDPGTGFMRARFNGGWYSPFDPTEVNFNYTEANGWQYNFYVPQDISTHIQLMGGPQKYEARLDELFNTNADVSGRNQADITGLIGQYAHGNEPSHHMAYLYNYVGKPWKTQQMIHRIVKEMYRNAPDGLAGNEDCGQMSAWLVLSAAGFYPVCPGTDQYAIGTPLFPELHINVSSGKAFKIIAKGLSDTHFYIAEAKLNGEPLTRSFLRHADLANGGILELMMSDQPSANWGVGEGNVPHTSIQAPPIVPAPFIESQGLSFTKSNTISMGCLRSDARIYYTLDGSDPTEKSPLYAKPFVITQNTTIKAVAVSSAQNKSSIVTGRFYQIDGNRKVALFSKYSQQYTAGGDKALIDGMRGNQHFSLGAWQGYEGIDFEAVVDLGKLQALNKVSVGFLQDVKSWICYPQKLEVSFSADGQTYGNTQTIGHTIPDTDVTPQIMDLTAKKALKARYVKVKAINHGPLPEWHPGAGGKAWLFVDEIVIE